MSLNNKREDGSQKAEVKAEGASSLSGKWHVMRLRASRNTLPFNPHFQKGALPPCAKPSVAFHCGCGNGELDIVRRGGCQKWELACVAAPRGFLRRQHSGSASTRRCILFFQHRMVPRKLSFYPRVEASNLNRLVYLLRSIGMIFGVREKRGEVRWGWRLLCGSRFSSATTSREISIYVHTRCCHQPVSTQILSKAMDLL